MIDAIHRRRCYVARRSRRRSTPSAASGALACRHGAPSTSSCRDALGIGVAVGAFGLSYGAVAVAAGLSVPQTCALSLLMFTGASQFALVGVVGRRAGARVAAALTALLLGSRNALYGLRLSSLLRVRGARRAVAAQLVIDESAAMALAPRPDAGFWATGLAVFVCWNVATLVGAIGGDGALRPARARPRRGGARPRSSRCSRRAWRPRGAAALALAAAAAALVAVPLTPAGVPVLVAALVAVAARGDVDGDPRSPRRVLPAQARRPVGAASRAGASARRAASRRACRSRCSPR